MTRRCLVIIALLGTAALAVAQDDPSEKPEGLTLVPERTVAFETEEGTYMNLDVSPDGSTIVFDLLGDLYSVPVTGGQATRLTSGMAYDIQPVFSPDGTEIAFVSDQSGSDNICMVRHYKQLGTNVIKQYMQPHRRQRQWVIQAAREEGMNVTNEGGGDFRLDLTMALDGYTGFEHSLPLANVYGDAVKLLAESKTWYTPTLVVSYGGPTAEWYFYQNTEVHDDEKLRRFTPHEIIDRRTRRGRHYADEEFHFRAVSEIAARVLQAGGNVALGAHGEEQGICAHWELWALQMGGLSNYDTLRTATTVAAAGLGMQSDLGQLSEGMLADLIVLDENPLDDIRNTNTVRYVMKNGELFDADTLDMIWPEEKKLPPFLYRDYGPPSTTEHRR